MSAEMPLKATPALMTSPSISLETSWEGMNLPKTQFGYMVGPNPPNWPVTPPIYRTIGKVTNHNGIFGGARFDAAIDGIKFDALPARTSLGVKGFYAGYANSQASRCAPGLGAPNGNINGDPPYCVVGPLVDDPTKIDGATGGSTESVQFDTRRRASHWGVAVELKTPFVGGPFFKPTDQPLAIKYGVAYRRIDQSLQLDAIGDGNTPGNPANWRFVTLRDAVNTNYLGGYLGLTSQSRMRNGVVLSVDGEVGLYGANSQYAGTYVESGSLFAPLLRGSATQSLTTARNQLAVIAALKVGADKDFGPFKLGVFARGEYYSYAPAIAYNDTQLDPLNGIVGGNNGTGIAGGQAWTYSFGARLIAPLGGPTR
jgi:hypothetical protein